MEMEALDQALGFKNAKNLLPVYRPWVGSGKVLPGMSILQLIAEGFVGRS